MKKGQNQQHEKGYFHTGVISKTTNWKEHMGIAIINKTGRNLKRKQKRKTK